MTPSEEKNSKPKFWSAALAMVPLVLFAMAIHHCAKASANELELGPQSKFPDGTALQINPIQDLNYKSKLDILNMRANAINVYRALLIGQYNATPAVFGEITDGKPWWGMAGQYIWGEGPRSIEGMSEESRFILNPFLLVGANPWTAMIWNKEKITEDDLRRYDFPYTWLPQSLRFWPSAKMGQVVYDVTGYNQRLRQYADKIEKGDENNHFGLVAYNARDFGYDYMFISPTQSANIENTDKNKDVVQIRHYIHTGDSSKYPGGCNNMSPAMAQIDDIVYTKLPARATVYLWKQRPPSVTAKPDLTFVVDLK